MGEVVCESGPLRSPSRFLPVFPDRAREGSLADLPRASVEGPNNALSGLSLEMSSRTKAKPMSHSRLRPRSILVSRIAAFPSGRDQRHEVPIGRR